MRLAKTVKELLRSLVYRVHTFNARVVPSEEDCVFLNSTAIEGVAQLTHLIGQVAQIKSRVDLN